MKEKKLKLKTKGSNLQSSTHHANSLQAVGHLKKIFFSRHKKCNLRSSSFPHTKISFVRFFFHFLPQKIIEVLSHAHGVQQTMNKQISNSEERRRRKRNRTKIWQNGWNDWQISIIISMIETIMDNAGGQYVVAWWIKC